MTPALSVALCALLTWTSLAVAWCQTTSETSTTQNSASNTSTAENSATELSDTSTSSTETSTTSLSQFSTTTSQTSTTLPGPFLLTQSVVFRSNGTQKEVELLVLGALGLALADATNIGYGPVVGLTGPAVVYEFVHDGHCAAGWITGHTARDDVEACALQCQENPECAFFAWDTVSTTCAMYRGEHGCPDDNNFATYNAYRLVRVCSDGLSLTPVTPSECPPNPDILGCNATRPGSLCEAEDHECGSDPILNNCGAFDVYRKEQISCMDDAQCPLQFRCSVDSGVCISDVNYRVTIAAIAELEPPSFDNEAINAFFDGLGDVSPRLRFGDFFMVAGFGDNLSILKRGGPADVVWRIDLEVVTSDVYSLEQVHEALGRLRDDTWERAAFLDMVQVIADNQSLFFDHFLFSWPWEGQPTNTTTATQTATIATTASTSFEASRSEPTTTATTSTTATTTTTATAAASATATATVTTTATTTTTAALATAGASRQPAARVENSTALIVGVAGGALVLLALLSGAAVLVLRRRKAVDAFQHKEPDCREPECKEQKGEEPEGNEWDVERAMAPAFSNDSGSIQI